MTAQLSRERRDIIEQTANHIISREDTSEHSENLRAVAELALLALSGMDSEPSFGDHMTLIDKGRLMMLERSHQTLLDYRADSVWYWQGDEDDQPEILSCPVIMSAETLRELLAKPAPPAQQPELAVWYGAMPESNGKTNWTAILHRKGEGRCFDGFTIDRSEYPGRVRYAADRVRYLIGENPERPHILDYDSDEHSGYAAAPAPVAVPDERKAFEEFMEKRFKDSIDRRQVKNGDGEYMAWDMQVAWIAWQKRAAMLTAGSVTVATVPNGWTTNADANDALVMLDRIDTVDCDDDERIESVKNIIRRLAAAPEQEV